MAAFSNNHFSEHPARRILMDGGLYENRQQKRWTFNIDRNPCPFLLNALDGFWRKHQAIRPFASVFFSRDAGSRADSGKVYISQINDEIR
jgi:hypothetical protein